MGAARRTLFELMVAVMASGCSALEPAARAVSLLPLMCSISLEAKVVPH
jgi:hypothetical protein